MRYLSDEELTRRLKLALTPEDLRVAMDCERAVTWHPLLTELNPPQMTQRPGRIIRQPRKRHEAVRCIVTQLMRFPTETVLVRLFNETAGAVEEVDIGMDGYWPPNQEKNIPALIWEDNLEEIEEALGVAKANSEMRPLSRASLKKMSRRARKQTNKPKES